MVLTRRDEKLLGVVLALVISAGWALYSTGPDAQGTEWAPDGLYVLAYNGTPYIEDELIAYIRQYTADTGIAVNVILTTEWDDAMVRAVVDDMPIDAVLVSFDLREQLRRAGRVIELHEILTEFPNPTFETAMRWMWSSIDDRPICGFLIGEEGEPTYACIWYQTEHPQEVAELIRYLVLGTKVREERLVQPNHFARKYLAERDFGAIYDYLLHPSRRKLITRDAFIAQNAAERCPGGLVQNVLVRGYNTNIQSKIDPMTGVYYGRQALKEYLVSAICNMNGRLTSTGMRLIETVGHEYPAVFIPNTSFDHWETPGEMTIR